MSFVDGDFSDKGQLAIVMKDIDVVYLNDVAPEAVLETILSSIEAAGVKHFVIARVPDIY